MNNLTQTWLKVVKANRLLPEGAIVFCIVDEGHQFRVKSNHTYSGVNEFIFDSSSRSKFIILN